jgi:tRNA (guanine26-N2/guanine27-N2)-dimethyltransferase
MEETEEIDFEEILSELEILEEGDIKLHCFPLKKAKEKGTALKKSMPVFYNPVMIMNRDITLIAYKAFQQKFYPHQDHTFSITDSMAASGIRTLRLYKFLNEPFEIIANDLNPLALKLIKQNLELNGIQNALGENQFKKIILHNLEANFLCASNINSRNYQAIVDVDPFGTPNIFIEPALRSLGIPGLLGITATDTPVLFGIRRDACFRKYNIRPLRSTFLKEVGLRILLYFTAIRAHPHMDYIDPFLSFSSDHYIRVFVRINKGQIGVDQNYSNFGYMLWCPACDWRDTGNLDFRKISLKCPHCNAKINYGGPLWIGKLHNDEFLNECEEILETTEQKIIPTKKKLLKILKMMKEENDLPPGYYDLHKICDRETIPIARTSTIMEKIQEKGYKVSRTHIEPHGIKSNIDIVQLKEILSILSKNIPLN